MASEQYSKFLTSLLICLILFSLLISPALAAAPNNNHNKVDRNPSSSNSSISVNSAPNPAPEFTQLALMAASDTTRISIDSSGVQGNATSSQPSISADGRYVVFTSEASNLVSEDTNGMADIFIRDRQAGTTTRISLSSSGLQGNSGSSSPAISADGRYVAYDSGSSNLVSGDTNGYYDIFVYDTQTNTTTRISVDSNGVQGNNGSGRPAISADGRYVAYYSASNNLVSGYTDHWNNIYIFDRQTNTTSIISISSSSEEANGTSMDPSISADGRYVAFWSSASNLVSGDTNGKSDVFMRDTQTNTTTRISVDSSGVQGNEQSVYPSISADGRYVAFQSLASNLVSGDTNNTNDVFVRDRQTGTITRVSVSSSGEQGHAASQTPTISADGRYVVFSSNSSNLVSEDTNGYGPDIFLRDTVANVTTRVSVGSSGSEGNNNSYDPSISADGRYVAFTSLASNLVSGDTNGVADVFMHENIVPFLDLPIDYSDTSFAITGNGNLGSNPGRVNSWFDHESPDYSIDGFIKRWDGVQMSDPINVNCTLGNNCYDGHSGIDFSHDYSITSENIYAAANGTVFAVVNNCKEGNINCGSKFGNHVWIKHNNGYATLYAHLNTVSVSDNPATVITDRLNQPLGTMGNTGRSTGTHLHFSLYYDQNGDGIWSNNEVVDPYGWQGTMNDPWNVSSSYLWIHPLFVQQKVDSSGGNASTPSGNIAVTVPAGAVVSPVTLELWDTPPVSGASAAWRSTGNSFWMRVLEWLTGSNSPTQLMTNIVTNSFDLPVTVTVHYDPSMMIHLDTSQLTIKQWDDMSLAWVTLQTTLDTVNQQVSAQTSQSGHFDLQAPLVCPADTLEPNDNYDRASVVQTDGMLVNNLFDVGQDEDWFKFNAVAGAEYEIQTKNLAASVDTALEIYDMDGLTLLVSDNNNGVASSLTWQATQTGLYFLRVSRVIGSDYGCNAFYQLSMVQMPRLFLPFIVR